MRGNFLIHFTSKERQKHVLTNLQNGHEHANVSGYHKECVCRLVLWVRVLACWMEKQRLGERERARMIMRMGTSVCVCVCVRERERERDRQTAREWNHTPLKSILPEVPQQHFSYLVFHHACDVTQLCASGQACRHNREIPHRERATDWTELHFPLFFTNPLDSRKLVKPTHWPHSKEDRRLFQQLGHLYFKPTFRNILDPSDSSELLLVLIKFQFKKSFGHLLNRARVWDFDSLRNLKIDLVLLRWRDGISFFF